jgi:hypothetical protein
VKSTSSRRASADFAAKSIEEEAASPNTSCIISSVVIKPLEGKNRSGGGEVTEICSGRT